MQQSAANQMQFKLACVALNSQRKIYTKTNRLHEAVLQTRYGGSITPVLVCNCKFRYLPCKPKILKRLRCFGLVALFSVRSAAGVTWHHMLALLVLALALLMLVLAMS